MSKPVRVTVWNEFEHERSNDAVKKLYPDGMHAAIASYLNAQPGIKAGTAVLQEPEHGLTEKVLAETDVLIWWGHRAHGKVEDAIVDRVQQAVLSGMGLIVLHSGHYSKIFKRMLGTNCSLKWREIGEKERLWNVAPGHPITAGIGDYFELPNTEMYGERFDIPEPDQLIFISWFAGGEVFRSGCIFNRGLGRIFYFRPGHETYPIYHNETVLKVIANAAKWLKTDLRQPTNQAPCIKVPLEAIQDHQAGFGKAGIDQN